ncbi:MAG: class 1 fructose-bisphosphatase [Caldilinea sp.]|nr:class 1 fructose-bisphosphatase [Caldilinea sp.]MDW8442683.1 class 1 fructose-bisphosphatase [Caldilineaceae bacterium]
MTDVQSYSGKLVTIERFILDQQRAHPTATGVLTNLLYDLALAAKIIASKTTRAGLAEILGSAGEENVQGEEVQRLDVFAQRTLYRLNDHTGRLAVMASEEVEDIIPIPERYPTGQYVLVFDPLDGSSNIDVNVSIGTIFGVYRRKTQEGRGTLEDVLQPGRNLVAAGYILYGASTMMVYSTGQGVHGFTLDPAIGEFLLSHPNIRLPEKPKYYSANQGYQPYWSRGVQAYTEWLQQDTIEKKALSLRYIGSLVADFHRNLLTGGVFYYPADFKDPKKPGGKLRLLYEAAPLAFLIEQAGGCASDGRRAILDIQPEKLHQRTPLFIGNRLLVEKAEAFIREYDG